MEALLAHLHLHNHSSRVRHRRVHHDPDLHPDPDRGTIEKLISKYAEIGTEGHDLQPYVPVLEHAKANKETLRLCAGFPPRTLAKLLMKEGIDVALPDAIKQGYLSKHEKLEGTEQHYNMVEAMITGRDQHDPAQPPQERFRKLFAAQLIKDAAMAHRVNTLIAESPPEDSFLVVCGSGHCLYGHGVPERILAVHPEMECYRVVLGMCEMNFDDAENVDATLRQVYGGAETSAGDVGAFMPIDDEADADTVKVSFNLKQTETDTVI